MIPRPRPRPFPFPIPFPIPIPIPMVQRLRPEQRPGERPGKWIRIRTPDSFSPGLLGRLRRPSVA